MGTLVWSLLAAATSLVVLFIGLIGICACVTAGRADDRAEIIAREHQHAAPCGTDRISPIQRVL